MTETKEKPKKSVKETPKKAVVATPQSLPASSYPKIAVVRIRGIRNMEPKIKHTLERLRLSKPHHCVFIPTTPQYMGMINLVKDYVAFGSIKEETLTKLIAKRGESGSTRFSKAKGEKKLDPVFRLHPPRRGYKDIKRNYPFGDLGKRPDMDDLLIRMM